VLQLTHTHCRRAVRSLSPHSLSSHCRRSSHTITVAAQQQVAAHTHSLSPHCTLMDHTAPNARTDLQPGQQRLEAHPGQDRPPLNSARAMTSSAAGRHASTAVHLCDASGGAACRVEAEREAEGLQASCMCYLWCLCQVGLHLPHGAMGPSYFPGALERAMASASRSMPFTPTMGRLW
jgi:hypothetical protein